MIKFIVVSDSMSPLIKIGDELKIEIVSKNVKFKRFEILLFKSEFGFTCHYFWKSNDHFDKGLIITRNLKDGDHDIPFDRQLVVGIIKNFKISLFSKLKIFLRDFFSMKQ